METDSKVDKVFDWFDKNTTTVALVLSGGVLLSERINANVVVVLVLLAGLGLFPYLIYKWRKDYEDYDLIK